MAPPEPPTSSGDIGRGTATTGSRHPIQWKRGLRRAGRFLWNDKVAAAHTVFYLVSAAIFLPLVAGMFLFMKDSAEAPPDPARGLDSRARSVLHQITTNPGLTADGSTYWESMGLGLAITEVGIRDEESSMLSYKKIDNLQRGGLVDAPGDPFLNYPEFHKSLRLGDNINFHIRMSPVILNPSGDPYGTKPLQGMHVAYVADLDDNGLGVGSYMQDHQFPTLSLHAQAEIAALRMLGLGDADPAAGFDGRFYQPVNADPLLYDKAGIPPEPGYTNDGVGVQEGDVIADTPRQYVDTLVGGTQQSYIDWFWQDYFNTTAGDNRFDAIVFGGDVDLTRWHDAESIKKLRDFVNRGGVLIYMGGAGSGAIDYVHQCSGGPTSCLLNSQGTQAAPTTPDDTNQMLFVPNRLATTQLDAHRYGVTWDICDESPGGVDERKGFIPIQTITPISGACVQTYFGATSADRYGAAGGTVILTQWNTTWADTTEEQKEVAKMFANLLSYGLLRPVYLDYGPEIPTDAPVVTAERLNLVQFPTGKYMDVKIWLYLWRGACGGDGTGCV